MNFIQFAASHGLEIDHLVEGRWARVKTSDKKKHRNGAYKFLGNIGFLQNHATMQDVAIWRPDGEARVSRTEWRESNRKAFAADRERQAQARSEAARLFRECERVPHPYLVKKGFPQAEGMVHPCGDLLIPMRDSKEYGVINTLQRIDADGGKKFLPGGKAKGSVFTIAKGALRERWLVEGYATGLSLQAALLDLRRPAEIIVCFSAGNLRYVAPMVKRPAYVFADNDVSRAGQEAAEASGLPWVMPPEEGEDANDVHRRSGIRALVRLVNNCTSATR